MLATTTPAAPAADVPATDVPLLGYAVMDQDHVDSVVLLRAACDAPAGQLQAPFAAFAKHLREHFSRENALMTRYGFFALHCHKDEHARVLKVVATMEAELEEGKEARARLYVTELFPDWFHTHLATMDRVTADFLAQVEG
ncbi:hemerythrin [Azospirillum sp. TSH100]|uniref:bacteriohemerythrin n=1 Tax=Azospirillum sp. TSH100 TaxID=652764 RepID=UPI000D620C8E|nr:hemerythrin family protein [Azospirillum sp. TSH100]PWC81794.1 hemerythrin [Azospirillum sp. TSH100]QCG86392.1 hemerythrin [Azospirillum sp. TSH100]